MERAAKLERNLDDETAILVFDIIRNVLDTEEMDWTTQSTWKEYPKWLINDNSSKILTSSKQHKCPPSVKKIEFCTEVDNFSVACSKNCFGNDNFLRSSTKGKKIVENNVARINLNIYRKKTCAFCKKNKESKAYCSSHNLFENGILTCPILQQCICNICGRKGHTSHCRQNNSKDSILKMINRFNIMKCN